MSANQDLLHCINLVLILLTQD